MNGTFEMSRYFGNCLREQAGLVNIQMKGLCEYKTILE